MVVACHALCSGALRSRSIARLSRPFRPQASMTVSVHDGTVEQVDGTSSLGDSTDAAFQKREPGSMHDCPACSSPGAQGGRGVTIAGVLKVQRVHAAKRETSSGRRWWFCLTASSLEEPVEASVGKMYHAACRLLMSCPAEDREREGAGGMCRGSRVIGSSGGPSSIAPNIISTIPPVIGAARGDKRQQHHLGAWGEQALSSPP